MHATTLLLLGFLAQASAPADTTQAKTTAQSLLTEGSALYEAGDRAGALAKFNAAYAAYPSPKLLFNIGKANRELDRPVQALEAFEQFVATAADASPDRIADARGFLADLQTKLGRIQIDSVTADAAISLDGKDVGLTPLPNPLWATPGRHQVTARHWSAPPDIQSVEVSAGAIQTVLIILQPVTAPVVVARVAKPEQPAAVVAMPVQERTPVVTDDGWWLGRKWTWVAVGSAVLFTAGALTAGAAMNSKFDSLNSSCGTASANQQGCTQSDLSALDTRKNTANVMWGLTAAAVVTAGVLFFVEGRPVSIAPLAGEATGLLASVRY